MPGRTDNMCLVRAQRIVEHTKRKHRTEPKKYDDDGELILYPAAPTKRCEVQNNRLQNIRHNALATLIYALEKFQHYIDEEIDMETLDLSNISKRTLRILRDELLSNVAINHSEEEWTPHYLPPPFLRAARYTGDRYLLECEDYISSECEDEGVQRECKEEEEEDMEIEPDGENYFLSASDRTWLHNVLRERLSEESFTSGYNMFSKELPIASLDGEVSFYRSYLLKKFLCEQTNEEENIMNDFKLTDISDVIRYFVQPDPEENGPIVLCPNVTTLSAMEVMEATRPRLRRTAGYIQQSKSYLQYLVGHTEEKPKCTKCKETNPNADTDVLEDLLKSMQSRLLIVDDKMQNAAETELGFPSEKCLCEQLAKSRNDFNLLQRRFLSIFLWPSLMSNIDLNKDQEYLIHQKNGAKRYKIDQELKEKYRKTKKVKKERKRRVKKEFTRTNPMKQNKKSKNKQYDETNIRRSQRNCVTNRKSYVIPKNEEISDESAS